MIEVFIDKRFDVRQRIAIERHVHDKNRNVLPRKERLYHAGYRPPNYPVPAIIYTPVLETACMWMYTGQPDDIRSSYPTYYRLVKMFKVR